MLYYTFLTMSNQCPIVGIVQTHSPTNSWLEEDSRSLILLMKSCVCKSCSICNSCTLFFVSSCCFLRIVWTTVGYFGRWNRSSDLNFFRPFRVNWKSLVFASSFFSKSFVVYPSTRSFKARRTKYKFVFLIFIRNKHSISFVDFYSICYYWSKIDIIVLD